MHLKQGMRLNEGLSVCPSSPAKRGRGTARRAVEGALQRSHLVCHASDCVSNFIDTRQIARGDTQNGDALLSEPIIAPQITLRPVAHVMTGAVDLDRKACLDAVEIENIRADRMLATKRRFARRALSQPAP